MNIRKHHVMSVLVITAVIIVMLRPELLSQLFVLVFIGIVPGTEYVIPSWASLLVVASALCLAVRWLFDTPQYHPVATTQERAARATARRRIVRQATPQHSTARHQAKRLPAKV